MRKIENIIIDTLDFIIKINKFKILIETPSKFDSKGKIKLILDKDF